ncbi:MAG: RNA polymerase subunit sigma-70 [Pseudomonadota bacterium]
MDADKQAPAALARQVKRIAHLDLPGGGQVVVERNRAYVGHMKPPHGTSIIDVSDPRHPRLIARIMLADNHSHTHKARVVGDILVTNVEQDNRHFLRLGARIPEAAARLERTLARAPTHAEIAAELKVEEADVPRLIDAERRGYRDGGFKIYDVSDPGQPRLLAYRKTYGFGVHRFDMDERYAYISTEMEGFVGNILVIYDLGKPERPQEVGRWWLPGQHTAGGETPTWSGYRNRLHHALRCGNELWASVWHAGLRVIDISDLARPRTAGAYDYHPPFPEPTHTVLRVPFAVAGRQVAVAIDEEHKHRTGQPHAGLWVFDVGDLGGIRPLSMFHLSEMDSPWSRAPGRFGAHQFQEHFKDTLVYATWFSGGLRIVDIADPFRPREVGHFIPEPCGFPAPQSNDVDVDARGLIYLLDRNAGFDILEFAGP